MLDLRLPIGWYFIINSALLFLAGLPGSSSMVVFQHYSINLNLSWAAVIGLFGLVMVGLSYSDKCRSIKLRSELRKLEIDQDIQADNSAAGCVAGSKMLP